MAEQTFPEPTVGVFIFNQIGELLLLKSHKWPGKYVVPGGHVELGERLADTAIREAKEETGLIFTIWSSSTFRNSFTTPPFGSPGISSFSIMPAKRNRLRCS